MVKDKLEVVLTGGRGLIGSALCVRLRRDGHRVRQITRNPKEEGDIAWDPRGGRLNGADLEGVDVVVHLAGESVAQRWNDAAKERILQSRVAGTALLSKTLAGLTDKPRTLLSASATGYYGDGGERVLDETSPLGAGFLAEVCEAWEAAADPARQAGIRVVHPRFGVVLSTDGGALAKMLTPFKMGVGGKIGAGDQYMSWVHIDDVTGALVDAIDGDQSGPMNVVSPAPVTNEEFTKALGEALHRPTFIPLPRFAAKLALGAEMADEMLIASQRVHPKVLQSAGFEFAFPTISDALRDLVQR